MTLFIKLIKNGTVRPTPEDISRFSAWFKSRFPLMTDMVVDVVEADLPIKLKNMNFNYANTNVELWGLDGIKQQIRDAGLVEKDMYQIVIFSYKVPEDWRWDLRKIAAYAYPEKIHGANFIEIPEDLGDPYYFYTHEIIHSLHQLCYWAGVATRDTMDWYDKDDQPEALDGNRARNVAELLPHQRVFLSPPKGRILAILKLMAEIYKKIIAITLAAKGRTSTSP